MFFLQLSSPFFFWHYDNFLLVSCPLCTPGPCGCKHGLTHFPAQMHERGLIGQRAPSSCPVGGWERACDPSQTRSELLPGRLLRPQFCFMAAKQVECAGLSQRRSCMRRKLSRKEGKRWTLHPRPSHVRPGAWIWGYVIS